MGETPDAAQPPTPSIAPELFRLALDRSLDAVTILQSVRDPSGAIVDFAWVYVNEEAAVALRQPAASLVGRNLLDVLPGNRESGLFARYVQVVETGVSRDGEIAYEADGIAGWFRNMAVRLGDGVAVFFRDVTEEKRTAEALRVSEERRRLAVAAAGLGDWYLNLATRTPELSRQCKQHLGLPPDAAPTIPDILACLHPEDRVDAGLQLEQVIAHGGEITAALRVLWPDGSLHWLALRGQALPGRPHELVGVTVDVTEQVWAERSQRLLADAGRLLAETHDYEATLAQVGRLAFPDLADYCILYLIDQDGAIQRTAISHRDPAGEAVLRELEQRYPLDLRGAAPIAQVLRGEVPLARARLSVADMAALARDARQRDLFHTLGTRAFLGVPLTAGGQRIGALLIATTTSDRQYGPREEELLTALAERAALAIANARLYAEAQASARYAEDVLARLNALVDRAPIGVAFFDETLRFARVNEQLAAINGLPPAAHLGRTVREVVPSLADVAEPLLARVLQEGKPILDVELAGETAAAPGEQRIWRESYYPVRASDGRLLGVGALVADITEQRGTELALRASEEQLRLAARQRDELFAFIAHDLKNPLTAILGATQMLQRRLRDPAALDVERLRRGLGTVETAVSSLTAQLNELQDIARLQAGQPLELQRRPVDLVALAQRAATLRQAATDSHQILLEAASQEIISDCDSFRIERVISNLLSNAVKYSPDGGTITLRLARETDGGTGWAVVEVRDMGVGIPPDDLPHIFERFYRGRNVTGIGGTGIGLASVAAIVGQHGGQVAAASEPGRGTSLTIRLPALEPL